MAAAATLASMILSSRMMAPPSFSRRSGEKTLSWWPDAVNPPRQESVAVTPADQEDQARLVEARDVEERFRGPVLPREHERLQPVAGTLPLLARETEAQVEAGVDPVGQQVRPPGEHVVRVVLVV